MYASTAPSRFRSTIRQTSCEPLITWMMSGLPSPLTSTFFADDELASHGSCLISVSRSPLVGPLVGLAVLEQPSNAMHPTPASTAAPIWFHQAVFAAGSTPLQEP